MDRTEAVELLEEEFPRLRLAHYRNLYDPTQIIADMLAAVSRAKDEVVDAETYAALAGAMLAKAQDPDAREAAERAGEVARVYAAYQQLVNRHANGTPYRRAKRTPLLRRLWLVQVANRRAPRARVARFTSAGGAGAWEVPVCPPGQAGPGPWSASLRAWPFRRGF